MLRLSWKQKRTVAVFMVCCAAVVFTTWIASHGSEDEPAETSVTLQPVASGLDRNHFMGARACLDCHRSEYVSWLKTQHYSNTKKNRFEATENSIDTKYRQAVGNVDLCYTCHAAPSDERFGRKAVETGTSCESCHGASGGNGGWLNRHAVYGPNVTRLENETPQHYADRTTACDNAGMVRPGRPYQVVKNCFGCHIIGHPTLVGEDVKHPVSFDKFSLIPYLLGEVRHNFHLNQRQNAETPSLETLRHGLSLQHRKRVYFIVEQLAKMEVALNHLANLPNDEALEEDFADDLMGIFEDAAGELEDFVEVLAEPEEEDIKALSEDELASLQGAIDEFEAFDDLDTVTRAAAAKSAGRISELAAEFLAAHDGSRLAALDTEFLEDLEEPVGDALKP